MGHFVLQLVLHRQSLSRSCRLGGGTLSNHELSWAEGFHSSAQASGRGAWPPAPNGTWKVLGAGDHVSSLYGSDGS